MCYIKTTARYLLNSLHFLFQFQRAGDGGVGVGDGGDGGVGGVDTVDTVDTVDMVYTVDMTHNEESFHTRQSCSNVSMGKTG